MKKLAGMSLFVFLLLSSFYILHAHEGHHAFVPFAVETDFFTENSNLEGKWTVWLNKMGRFHLIFLHFPIALIMMTALAEILWILFKNPLFSHAARFMIIAAAVLAVPTAFLGFAFSYGNHYEGLSLELFVWHRYFGYVTAGLAVITAILKERYIRQKDSSSLSYYLCLIFLFLSVSLTGAFGGSLAFGLDVW